MKRNVSAILGGLAIASLALGWMASWLLSPLDRALYDALLATHLPAADTDRVRYVLVKHWPCRRSDIGRAIRRVHAAGARAIGLDIALDEVVADDPYRNEKESVELAQALAACPGVVIAVERGANGEFLMPARVFGDRDTYEVGNAHFRVDPDGAIRRAQLRSFQGDQVVWALGLKLAQHYLGVPAAGLPRELDSNAIELGGHRIRMVDGAVMIRYGGEAAPVYRAGKDVGENAAGVLAFEDWLGLPATVDAALFSEKVVLLGAVTGSGGDTFRTPLTASSNETPGIVVHGEMVATLLRGDAPALLPGWLLEACLAVLVLLVIAVGLRAPAWAGPLLSAALAAGYFGCMVPALFAGQSLALPAANPLTALVAAPVLAMLARRSVRGSTVNALDFLRDHLERGGAIGDLLRVQAEIEDQLRSYEVERTVMFTDIKGSTTFFTKYGDREGRKMVERHNALLFPLIERRSGHVIKTIGDAIMASFRRPIDAVEAAASMQRELAALNGRAKRVEEQIHVRIGLNSGTGIADPNDLFGNLVNVAARVEAQADGDQIFISRSVYDALDETWRARCRSVGQRAIRGTGGEIELFDVLWDGSAPGPVAGEAGGKGE
ncbi:MAG: adenylate/guanylate cyclase domain-containing protein [Candidatus Wallbacteria bacterium]|nr:adenylate/guanylate cyclase domain-containing protein [Candidatus Wallbacteria bacterium]